MPPVAAPASRKILDKSATGIVHECDMGCGSLLSV